MRGLELTNAECLVSSTSGDQISKGIPVDRANAVVDRIVKNVEGVRVETSILELSIAADQILKILPCSKSICCTDILGIDSSSS